MTFQPYDPLLIHNEAALQDHLQWPGTFYQK